MRDALLGSFLLMAFVISGDASAGASELSGGASPAGVSVHQAPAARKPTATSGRVGKQVATRRAVHRQSLPATPPVSSPGTDLPIAPLHRDAPPQDRPWTGFHAGFSVGGGR